MSQITSGQPGEEDHFSELQVLLDQLGFLRGKVADMAIQATESVMLSDDKNDLLQLMGILSGYPANDATSAVIDGCCAVIQRKLKQR